MSIDFRKFDSKIELETQRDLFKECFPETVGTPVVTKEHYNWKFQSKKGAFKSAEFVAESEDGMLGYYSAIPYQYQFKDKVLNAAMVCDVMTGVKARGKGLFTKLGAYSTDQFKEIGFDFSTGYPIRKEVIPGHLKVGWEINFELPLYMRVIKFDSFLKKRKLGFFAPLANVFLNSLSGLCHLFVLPSNNKLTVETISSEAIDSFQAIGEFYSEWAKEVAISLVKDVDFLKWRLGAPEKKYHISILKEGTSIVGVMIAREVVKEGVPCIGIVDLAVLKKYQKYTNLLTDEMIAVAKKNKAEMLLIMMSKTGFQNYKLAKNLFFKSPFKFYLIVKQFSQNISSEILKKESNWHLMWIDSDDL